MGLENHKASSSLYGEAYPHFKRAASNDSRHQAIYSCRDWTMVRQNNLPELIRVNIGNLMRQWEVVVRREVPAASGLEEEILFNGIPEFLENLANCFSVEMGSAGWEDFNKKKIYFAMLHGTQRAGQATYTLDQVIAEHQILRRMLLHLISEKSPVSAEQWNILMDSIDAGISEAATAFALQRGFKDAKYHQLESEKNQIEMEKNTAYSVVSKLELEKGMREKFVSMLSHDMRTPISSAKLAADLILRCSHENQLVFKLASKIIKDLLRSDRMIRDLLDANRIRLGEKLPLELRETKLIQLIENTLANLAEIYGERFKLESHDEIVGHWSDEDLQRAIENLAINAVKYGADDTPIDIRVVDQGKVVSISVHNSGSFIPPEEKHLLFERPQQLGILNKPGKRGWGLGLTLVQGIVKAHGGKVLLESELEQGTTFTLVIPKDGRMIEGAGSEPALAS